MDLLIDIAEENKVTLMCVTHNSTLYEYFDKTVDISEINFAVKNHD